MTDTVGTSALEDDPPRMWRSPDGPDAHDLAQCLFCGIRRKPARRRAWHDQILAEVDGFAVLPGLGAQAVGYLLIVPQPHVFSFGELPTIDLQRAESVLDKLTGTLEPGYGPTIVFEHGACAGGERTGNCIDHAHLHVVPTRAPLLELVLQDRSFSALTGMAELQRFSNEPYLALRAQDHRWYGATGVDAKGQYFRRFLGRALARPHDWDYTASPAYDTVAATIVGVRAMARSWR